MKVIQFTTYVKFKISAFIRPFYAGMSGELLILTFTYSHYKGQILETKTFLQLNVSYEVFAHLKCTITLGRNTNFSELKDLSLIRFFREKFCGAV